MGLKLKFIKSKRKEHKVDLYDQDSNRYIVTSSKTYRLLLIRINKVLKVSLYIRDRVWEESFVVF